MKKYLCLLLISQTIGCASQAPPNASTLEIAIAKPEFELGLHRRFDGDPDPHLHVVLRNVSAKPLWIYDEWNSWGYGNLTVQYQMADGAKGTLDKPSGQWTRNFPTSTKLEPNEILARDVYFGVHEWSGAPALAVPESITFRAMFRETDVERGSTAWNGVVESPPMTVKCRP